MNSSPIDLVVLWLDDKDPLWKNEFNQYNVCSSPHYYRDWGWLRYWFRGVEENVPWINKVFFITYGHLPKWLNTSNPKLRIVKHSDYMPKEYLPTFSSIPLELNLHRIPELSEQFIFSNDDLIFVGNMKEEDYFIDGLPCDKLHARPITQSRAKKFNHILLNNMVVLNRHFNTQESANEHMDKWFSPQYTNDIIDDNRAAIRWDRFLGLSYDHMPIPLLKSKLRELWNEESSLMNDVCSHRFRDEYNDVNIYLCRFWNLAQGNFVPYLRNPGVYCKVSSGSKEIESALQRENAVVCLNDVDEEIQFEETKTFIHSLLKELYPNKSSFEL